MTNRSELRRLRELAELHGILTSYRDAGGRKISASDESLTRILVALGAPILALKDAPAAIEEYQAQRYRRAVQPVCVCWDGQPPTLEITLPESAADRTLELCLSIYEDQPLLDDPSSKPAKTQNFPLDLKQAKRLRRESWHNTSYVTFSVPLTVQLPFGYHTGILNCTPRPVFASLPKANRPVDILASLLMTGEAISNNPAFASLPMPGEAINILFISAPANVSQPGGFDRLWGTFSPLYALRGAGSQGIGDFSDLRELIRWTQERGGRMVGILPTLAGFLDKVAYEYSPYAPASRCFWNEVFIAVDALAESVFASLPPTSWRADFQSALPSAARLSTPRPVFASLPQAGEAISGSSQVNKFASGQVQTQRGAGCPLPAQTEINQIASPAFGGFAKTETSSGGFAKTETDAELLRLRQSDLVEYDAVMRWKRARMEALINDRRFRSSEYQMQLQDYRRDHPALEDYARFRAVGEMQGAPWQVWKIRLRKGQFRSGDYNPKAVDYHAFAQWAAERQLGEAYRAAQDSGVALYLDLPLGGNACGWEVFRSPREFTLGASAGAPPDALFVGGQDWAFPPLHPERIREAGYRTLIRTLRHNMKYADVLRLDHVMGLHRLFTIPHGMTPADGVYVRYRAEEMYAVICLEAWRSKTAIIGEDLGTVPPETRVAMDRHGFNRMSILQLSLGPAGLTRPDRLPASTLAALNTHDVAPFAGFWQGSDIDEMDSLKVISAGQAASLRVERGKQRARLLKGLRKFHGVVRLKSDDTPAPSQRSAVRLKSDGTSASDGTSVPPPDPAQASLEYLAGSSAGIVLVNLEDLWGDDHQQNIPGTWRERPNWRFKIRFDWEEVRDRPDVLEKLARIDRLRKTERLKRRKWRLW